MSSLLLPREKNEQATNTRPQATQKERDARRARILSCNKFMIVHFLQRRNPIYIDSPFNNYGPSNDKVPVIFLGVFNLLPLLFRFACLFVLFCFVLPFFPQSNISPTSRYTRTSIQSHLNINNGLHTCSLKNAKHDRIDRSKFFFPSRSHRLGMRF